MRSIITHSLVTVAAAAAVDGCYYALCSTLLSSTNAAAVDGCYYALYSALLSSTH
jgi:hypothetical protein